VEWAKRMTLTGICSEGVVYFAGRKLWATDTFHLFERFVSYGKQMPDGRTADKNYVWLSEWQLENINSNYLLPIDFDTYRQLKNHIAKALVPLLQIWLYATREGGCFEKRYDDLCQILNIRQYPHLSRIIEKLEPSLQELVTHGYLADWRVQQTSDGTGYKIAFHHGAKFPRGQKSWLANGNRTPQPDGLPLSGDESISRRMESQVDQELVTEMMQRGISERGARELLANLAIGQQVTDQLEWGDFQIQQASRGKFHNPAGFYIRLIRDNISPPESFETSRKQRLREDAQRAQQKEQEEKATIELAYLEYKDRTIDKYIHKNYSKGFYASCVRKKLEELMQDRRLKERWNEGTLSRMAETRLRQDIATRVPLMTFQEFWEQQRQQSNSDQPLLPGFVAAQPGRT
jgi:hypothetical protein